MYPNSLVKKGSQLVLMVLWIPVVVFSVLYIIINWMNGTPSNPGALVLFVASIFTVAGVSAGNNLRYITGTIWLFVAMSALLTFILGAALGVEETFTPSLAVMAVGIGTAIFTFLPNSQT